MTLEHFPVEHHRNNIAPVVLRLLIGVVTLASQATVASVKLEVPVTEGHQQRDGPEQYGGTPRNREVPLVGLLQYVLNSLGSCMENERPVLRQPLENRRVALGRNQILAVVYHRVGEPFVEWAGIHHYGS